MADPVRSATIKFLVDLAQLEGDMGKAAAISEKAGDKISKSFGKVKEALIGIGEIVAFGEIINETAKAEKAFAQLEAVVKSTGGTAGYTAEQLDEMADSFRKVSTFSNTTIVSSEAVLAGFTKIGKEVFPEAEKAALNLATRMGGDLQGATVKIGKALQDPIKGLTALSKAGIQFDESQKAMIKSLVDSGDLLDAQKIVLDRLNTSLGGAANAARNTLGGAFDAARNAAEHFLESLGKDSSGGLQGVLNAVANGFDLLSQHAKEVDAALAGIAAGAGMMALAELPEIIEKIASTVKVAIATMGAETAAVTGGMTIAVGVLAAAMVEYGGTVFKVGDRSVTAWNLMRAEWEETVKAFQSLAISVQDQWTELSAIFEYYAKQLAKTFGGVFDAIGKGFMAVFQAVGLKSLVANTQQTFNGLAKQLGDYGKQWTGDWVAGIDQITKHAAQLTAAEKQIKSKDSILNPFSGETDPVTGKKKKEKAYNTGKDFDLPDVLAKIDEENKARELGLHYSGVELEFQQKKLELEDKYSRQLLPFELQSLRAEFDQRAKIKALIDAQMEVEKARKQWNTDIDKLKEEVQKRADILAYGKDEAAVRDRIRQAEAQGLPVTQQMEQSYRNQLDAIKQIEAAQTSQDFVKGLEDKLADMQEQSKEQELINEGRKTEAAVQKDIYELQKKIKGAVDDTTKAEIAATEQRIHQQDLMDEGAKIMNDMKSEADKYADSVSHLDELLRAGALSWDAYAKKVADLNPKLKQFKDIGHEVGKDLANAMDSWLEKGGKFSDVIKQLGKDLLKLAEQKLIMPAVSNIFDNIANRLFQPKQPNGYGGAGTPWGYTPLYDPGMPGVNGYLPQSGGIPYSGQKFAMGGFPPVGMASMVGENGPEMFVPQQPGMIIPNHMLNSQSSYSDLARALSQRSLDNANSATAMGQTFSAAYLNNMAQFWLYQAGRNIQGNGFGMAPQIINTPQELAWLNGDNSAFAGWHLQAPVYVGDQGAGEDDGTASGMDVGRDHYTMTGADMEMWFKQQGYTGPLGGVMPRYNGGVDMGPQTQGYGPGGTGSSSQTFGPPSPPPWWQSGAQMPRIDPGNSGVPSGAPGYSSNSDSFNGATNQFPPMTSQEMMDWVQGRLDPEKTAQLKDWGYNDGILQGLVKNAALAYYQRGDFIGGNLSDGERALFHFAGIRGFARGGRPTPRKPALIGEAGAEIFVPDSAGTIVPNDKIGSGGGANVNIEIHNHTGAPVHTEEVSPGLWRVIIGKLVNDMKGNGTFAQALKRTYNVSTRPAGRA